MKTLIVPCAGKGMLDGKPKYLAQHPDGKLLIQKCLERIPVDGFQRILVVILQRDIDRYRVSLVVEDALKALSAEIIALQDETARPAETVYQAMQLAMVQGSVVIKDSDNCFLIINEQRQIMDIFEKQFKSDVICAGLYGFADATDYLRVYERLNDHSYPIQPLYVSHIIPYLIGYVQRVFRYVPCTSYEDWGNEKVWADVQKR